MKRQQSKRFATRLVSAFATSALASAGNSQIPIESGPIPKATPASSVEVTQGAKLHHFAGETQFVISVPEPLIPFGDKERRRFLSLAAKRALGTASEAEQAEFLNLQRSRSAAPEAQIPDEILAAYRRRQMVLDAKIFFQRHVRFIES